MRNRAGRGAVELETDLVGQDDLSSYSFPWGQLQVKATIVGNGKEDAGFVQTGQHFRPWPLFRSRWPLVVVGIRSPFVKTNVLLTQREYMCGPRNFRIDGLQCAHLIYIPALASAALYVKVRIGKAASVATMQDVCSTGNAIQQLLHVDSYWQDDAALSSETLCSPT